MGVASRSLACGECWDVQALGRSLRDGVVLWCRDAWDQQDARSHHGTVTQRKPRGKARHKVSDGRQRGLGGRRAGGAGDMDWWMLGLHAGTQAEAPGA